MPLSGRVLIEASAGTGKTFTIGLIFLRLLLERGLHVEQILVATFTDRAAQELRDRLRARLIEAERGLRALPPAEPDELSLANWLATFHRDEDTRKLALRRVQLARADLDRAPIGTIHSWCQRVLRDFPLESGAALLPETLVDESTLLRECVEDFWRRRYLTGAATPEEFDSVGAEGVDGLVRDLKPLIGIDARILPLDSPQALADDVAELRTERHVAVLREWHGDASLYSKRKVRLRFGEIVDMIERGGDVISVIVAAKADCLLAGEIESDFSPKGMALCTHETLVLIRRIRSRASEKAQKRRVRAAVLSDAIAFCREEILKRARHRDVRTFSMLIDTVHERLCGSGASAAFAQTLFDAFPAALIDEFQDTDRRQFEIFDCIYQGATGEARGFLAMIGDPKQAIYAFRGGDIAAYLQARETADHQFALGVNHRSSSPLITAFNALYARTRGGFETEAIVYRPVVASGTADEKPFARGGDIENRPLSIHRFADADETALGVLDERALDDCAERIAELLNDSQAKLGERRVMPGDVAVLVAKNEHVAELRRRLVDRRVPCVGAGRDNVFETDIARDLELVLYAALNAGDERAVRGAMCTALLGATLNDVRAWQSDPSTFELALLRFDGWRELARTHGAPALIHAIVAERAAALLAFPDGERVLTDLRHLGELLADDAQARQGLDATYTRLAALRRGEDAAEDDTMKARRVRIESDSARVQVMTVHAAKGLQFPIVFVPFAWRPKELRSFTQSFHDATGRRCIDLGSSGYDEHSERAAIEDLQERLRLFYVAVTRAEYATHVYWADTKKSEGVSSSALGLLLLQIAEGAERGDVLNVVAHACEGVRIVDPYRGAKQTYHAQRLQQADLVARTPLPTPRPFVWLHSFSSLTRHAPLATAESAASDEIETKPDTDLETVAESAMQFADDETLLSIDAWRGRHFGNALHAILEDAASGDVWPHQRDLLRRHLGPIAVRGEDGDPLAPVGRMVDRVRFSDLGDGLRLGSLTAASKVAEFEFQLPIDVSVQRLRETCVRHGFVDVIPSTLGEATLRGMLTGFADLIFERGGRYHVLDYKTNWLGNRLQDYDATSLNAAMAEHHYALQALIYTVALHRYLGGRLNGYAPERHLGESWYLFVRAVGLGEGIGVWRRQWSATLIEALDAAFSGMKQAA
jgi:exodeoxyribonuclease V beta subunit